MTQKNGESCFANISRNTYSLPSQRIGRGTKEKMVEALQPVWRSTPKRGVKPKLGLSDRVLVALEYWREYRTYFHIGNSWGVSESTVCRIVH